MMDRETPRHKGVYIIKKLEHRNSKEDDFFYFQPFEGEGGMI